MSNKHRRELIIMGIDTGTDTDKPGQLNPAFRARREALREYILNSDGMIDDISLETVLGLIDQARRESMALAAQYNLTPIN